MDWSSEGPRANITFILLVEIRGIWSFGGSFAVGSKKLISNVKKFDR
jgi:hypothetical protein